MYQQKETASAKREDRSSLRIDAPDSVHEKEAEQMSAAIVNGDQLTGHGGAPKGMIMGNAVNNGMIVPGKIQQEIFNAKGSGEKLTQTERKLGGEHSAGQLEDVRIHTDNRAAELAKSVNAKAFTYGKDIFFGNGQYNLTTTEGKQLLSHELVHTGQNSGWGLPCIQRIPQDTLWGTFEDITYDEQTLNLGTKKKPDKQGIGINIYMKFKPMPGLDAEEIGMTQIAKGYIGGHTGKNISDIGEKTRRKHFITPESSSGISEVHGEEEEGFHIDQGQKNVSPIYTTEGTSKKIKSLADGPNSWPATAVYDKKGVVTGYVGWGKYGYPQKTGEDRNAELLDTPTFGDVIPDAGQLFETTALVTKGALAGTYLGSVKWGWTRTAADATNPVGVFTKHPFELASKGAASTTFLKAAAQWNISQTSKKEETIDLPLPEIYRTEATDFFVGETFNAGSKSSVPASTRVQKIPFTAPVKEMPGLTLVKIIDGPLAGISGWIDDLKLSPEDYKPKPVTTTK